MEDLEKDIKKYFQKRQIQPSENAWNRMEMLLNEEKVGEKKKKIFFYLVPIVASVVLFVGIWLSQEKSEIPVLETKPRENFVVNHAVISEEDHSLHENQRSEVKHATKIKSAIKKEQKQFTLKQESLILTEKSPQKDLVNSNADENFVIKEQDFAMIDLIEKPVVEIKVNTSQLLRSADLERTVESSLTGGQSFWKKVKEINTVVEHRNN